MEINVRCLDCGELLELYKADTNNYGDEIEISVRFGCKCSKKLEDKIEQLEETIEYLEEKVEALREREEGK